jgi:hypothetical protein
MEPSHLVILFNELQSRFYSRFQLYVYYRMLLPSLLSVKFIQRDGYLYEVYLLCYCLQYFLASYVTSKLYLVETCYPC